MSLLFDELVFHPKASSFEVGRVGRSRDKEVSLEFRCTRTTKGPTPRSLSPSVRRSAKASTRAMRAKYIFASSDPSLAATTQDRLVPDDHPDGAPAPSDTSAPSP